MALIKKSDILTALHSLGIHPGQSLIVHTSLSSIGYVIGGSQTVIEALHPEVQQENWPLIRDY